MLILRSDQVVLSAWMALTGTAPSHTMFNSHVALARSPGGIAAWTAEVNAIVNANFAGADGNARLADTVIANLGLGAVTGIRDAAIAFFNSQPANRGGLAIAAADWLRTVTPAAGDTALSSAQAAFRNAELGGISHSTNPASVQSAATTPGAPITGGGQTFLLTQGLDNIVGTAGNDTINAFAFNTVTGADVTTLQSVDAIDGGAGTDTLNIEVKPATAPAADFNDIIQGTISNVEIVNINNTATTTPAAVDATKLGAAVQQIWQIGAEAGVTKLAASTTAGFKDLATFQTLEVTPADVAATVTVALSNVAEGSTLKVLATGTGILNSVALSGTVADTDNNGAVANTNVAVTVGKDVQTLSVNSAVATTLSISNGAGTKAVTTIDASASTGAIAYSDSETTVATITTGSGKDAVAVVTATSNTAGSVVNASVTTNAGNDTVTVTVTGTGTTTVNTGDGNDTVNVTTRSSGKLTVNLGDGTDSFTSSVAINGTDAIDAGAGVDTLLLSLVGSANVGAFSNFDVFDVKGMTANLDLDILNAKNTVTEIVGSGALAATLSTGTTAANVSLLNVGAGVNFRATADMAYDSTTATTGTPAVDAGYNQGTLTLTQKTAGALTVTLDADETGTADTTIDTAATSVIASNATSLKAVFDTSYLATITGETTTGDNVSTITLAGAAATSLEVVSGGALSSNVLVYTDTAATAGKLASMTITGDRALDLTFSSTNATALTTVDASAQTGGLTFSLANLKDTGTVKLGSGVDHITVTSASTGATGAESIQGLEKALAVSVSTATADATAKAAAIADADTLVLASAQVADADYNGATAGTGTLTGGAIDKGILTFTGAGPATLADAIAIANLGAETAGEAVLFEYVGNSYVFVQGTTDTVVKLVGITGVTNFVESTTADNFFIV